MSVCMHSRSRHPSQQRIPSHRRSSTRVPPPRLHTPGPVSSAWNALWTCSITSSYGLHRGQTVDHDSPSFRRFSHLSEPAAFQCSLFTLCWPPLFASSLHRVWQALLSYRLTRGTPSMRFRFVDLLGERRRRSKESRATGSFISYWPGVLECLHIYAYLLLPTTAEASIHRLSLACIFIFLLCHYC